MALFYSCVRGMPWSRTKGHPKTGILECVLFVLGGSPSLRRPNSSENVLALWGSSGGYSVERGHPSRLPGVAVFLGIPCTLSILVGFLGLLI
jgi:hypothetical protein